jgi:hypothetical protein
MQSASTHLCRPDAFIQIRTAHRPIWLMLCMALQPKLLREKKEPRKKATVGWESEIRCAGTSQSWETARSMQPSFPPPNLSKLIPPGNARPEMAWILQMSAFANHVSCTACKHGQARRCCDTPTGPCRMMDPGSRRRLSSVALSSPRLVPQDRIASVIDRAAEITLACSHEHPPSSTSNRPCRACAHHP